MNTALFTLRSARRAPLRMVMTVLAVAITLVAFLLLRSLSAGWTEQVEQTPNNRVVSRHKVGWSQSMPIRYVEEIRTLPGIKHSMGGSWVEAKYPGNDKKVWLAVTAVQARPFADMHYELEAPQAQKEAWVARRDGALVSKEMADLFGWELGDIIQLKGTFLRGTWDVSVQCIVESSRHGFGHNDIFMHWEYYNEKLPAEDQGKINIVSSEIFEPKEGANIARAIDIHFDSEEHQTYTQEDQALNASFVGMFGAILGAIDIVSVLVLGIILLLIGNTVAMGVRERTHEYGVLRAIGFRPRHVALFVLSEASLLGVLGAVVGIGLSFPLIESAVSRFLEEEMQFAPLSVPLDSALIVLLLGALLGALSASIPAYKASKLEVVDSLRRVE